MIDEKKVEEIYNELCELIDNAEIISSSYENEDGYWNTEVEHIDIDDIRKILGKIEDLF